MSKVVIWGVTVSKAIAKFILEKNIHVLYRFQVLSLKDCIVFAHTEPFEKIICEISNRFGMKRDQVSSWDIAQGIVNDIGGHAVNVAATTMAGDQVAWGRSSMTERWLRRYEAKKYHLVDPFIDALLAGRPDVMTDCGVLQKSDRAYALNHDLKSHGYGSLYGSTNGSLTSGYRSIVVFCSAQSLSETDEYIGFDRLKIIHAIIAANMPAQPDDVGEGLVTVRKATLTPKETDVLCWLACGLRNDQIAFNGNIAEVTVRKHLISIRKKLGAATREQAIAIAVRDAWINL